MSAFAIAVSAMSANETPLARNAATSSEFEISRLRSTTSQVFAGKAVWNAGKPGLAAGGGKVVSRVCATMG